MNGEISLYFHIPFCSHKCPYCHFYVVADKEPLKETLLQGLALEWQNIPKEGKLTTVYFGGGTPTLFGHERIRTVLDWIARSFGSLEGIEITIEANPEQINSTLCRNLKEIGINRVSIGIQSFDQNELSLLDRRHSPKKAIDAIYCVKEAGIINISIDLMYELPRQSKELWRKTLATACQLPITHLSLYNLTIEPHTPFARREEELKKLVPDQEVATWMYLAAIEELSKHGLHQYEISAFCKKGFESRHNMGYWIGRPFYGLGPSAFSFDGIKRFRNVAHLPRYTKLLQENMSPIDFVEELPSDARRKELLALGLRLNKGVKVTALLPQDTLDTISRLEEEGFLETRDDILSLTQKGILFYDTVAAELI